MVKVFSQLGGHYIVITGYENGYLKIYDPYLYSGKFETSTRKGKAIVQGNTVYVTPANFQKYANYKSFFIYKHETTSINNQAISTAKYEATVKVKSSLNVRNAPGGAIIGKISNDSNVTIYETSGNWARIGDNKWVSLDYIIKVGSKLGTYYISCSSLKLRTEHNLNSTKYIPKGNIITKLSNGTYVNVIEIYTYYDQIWGRLPQGWICLSNASGLYANKVN